ncbi:MAG: tetraacyldisaccharide 4'-kinase [Alphaproteobacteria bacterium]|nr:tetraacyldisaccharide 4'-kinase [Alphaproteobacteria bacterium]
MNLNNVFLKSFRFLLFPFAILYGLIVYFRNVLYDFNVFKSVHFNIKTICVGNISSGGTGKTPMVEFLIGLIKDHYKLAVLSRGYKRKSHGFLIATEKVSALEMGDEPYQFFLKFPDQTISVCENRLLAIPLLVQQDPNLELIILDDAFQHRSIFADYNIVLTEFNNLYTRDFYLPTGELRDNPRSAARAQMIIVTKCPTHITENEMIYTKHKLKLKPHQKLFFSCIEYGIPYHLFKPKDNWILTPDLEVLLVFGIANPLPLKNYILENTFTYYQLDFDDHHIFTSDDMKEILKNFFSIPTNNKIILTTEKDAVRLVKFKSELEYLPIYVLPINFSIINETEFKKEIFNYLKTPLP